MTIFETEQDIIREKKAIEAFVGMFDGSYRKLDPLDIDYKVFDKNNKLIAYAEVKGRLRSMRDAYPLPISVRKLAKILDKRLTAVLIWCCEDGIIYAKANDLHGIVKIGGHKPREGAVNDIEMMVYYDKQKAFKYLRFI